MIQITFDQLSRISISVPVAVLVAERNILFLNWANAKVYISHREALPDPGCGCGRRGVPHALVTEHVGRKLGLGLGYACAGGSVVAVDLK